MRALLLLLLLGAMNAADLAFERDTVTLQPKAGSEREIVSFPFRNTGTQELTITKVDTPCACTNVDLDKRTYQAGEKGEITVIFDTNGLSGLQEKSIQVYYDRGPMILLHIKALLAEAPSIAPTFLTWKVGAATDEQVAVVTMPAGVSEHVTEVSTSSPAVTATLYPRDRDYAITVKPTSTANATNVMITVRTDLGRTVRVFACVEP